MTDVATTLHNRSRCRVPYTLIMCQNQAREVLFVKRFQPPYPGRWNFVGGKIHRQESPRESACRELLEEAGIRRHPKYMKFCGMAVWPEDTENRYCGMFLFRTRFNRSSYNFSQRSLMDEGLLSWNPIEPIGDVRDYVPNLAPLLEAFAYGQEFPVIMFHEMKDDTVLQCTYYKIKKDWPRLCDCISNDSIFHLESLVGTYIVPVSNFTAHHRSHQTPRRFETMPR